LTSGFEHDAYEQARQQSRRAGVVHVIEQYGKIPGCLELIRDHLAAEEMVDSNPLIRESLEYIRQYMAAQEEGKWPQPP